MASKRSSPFGQFNGHLNKVTPLYCSSQLVHANAKLQKPDQKTLPCHYESKIASTKLLPAARQEGASRASNGMTAATASPQQFLLASAQSPY
eukprot:scaffold1582_cov93-Cylindrotheca_fusiformis.AAC.4